MVGVAVRAGHKGAEMQVESHIARLMVVMVVVVVVYIKEPQDGGDGDGGCDGGGGSRRGGHRKATGRPTEGPIARLMVAVEDRGGHGEGHGEATGRHRKMVEALLRGPRRVAK